MLTEKQDSLAPMEVELNKVLASRVFTHSERLRRFLRYAVEHVTKGDGGKLKEYELGVQVFDRGSSFDPRTDPIVRVEAGRLRTKLMQYYRTDGRHDPVRIEVLKGGYIPVLRDCRSPKSEQGQRTVHRSRKWQAIAVLPFANLSPESEQEYLCDGIAEELASSLMKESGIRVASPMSTYGFKGKYPEIRQIGERLNVSGIVGGSVRRAGERVRITAHLTNVADGYLLWSVTHEGNLQDVFALQSKISSSIIEHLRTHLQGCEAKAPFPRHTPNPDAYPVYLKGRYHWNKRTNEDLKTAIQYFQHAIAADDNYALAYAGLADSYAILGNRGAFAPREVYPNAESAAQKALEIDSTVAEAHTSLALVRAVYDWDWPAAEQGFRRAMDLNPWYATTCNWYAVNCLAPLGRLDEAVDRMRQAEELDPISLVISTVRGRIFYFQRQYDRAIEQLSQTLRMDPHFYLAHWHLGQCYERKGMFEQAVAALEQARAISPASTFVLGVLGQSYGRWGKIGQAEKLLSDLDDLSKSRYVCATDRARIHLGLGQKDRALECLFQAREDQAIGTIHLGVDPAYDTLHSEPAFNDLLKNVGLKSHCG